MPTRPPAYRPAHYQPGLSRRLQLAELDQRRGSSAGRGYDAAWRRLRLSVLQEEPLCRQCHAAGRVEAATEVHHTIKVAHDRSRRLDRSVLVPLCRSCHSKLTTRGF